VHLHRLEGLRRFLNRLLLFGRRRLALSPFLPLCGRVSLGGLLRGFLLGLGLGLGLGWCELKNACVDQSIDVLKDGVDDVGGVLVRI